MKNQPGTNRPIWHADKHVPELSNRLREGLNSVLDPELDLSVMQLGLIRNATIEEDHAAIEMILTTPFCPYAPALIEMVRDEAETVLDRTVSIELGMEAWDISMMEEGLADDWGLY